MNAQLNASGSTLNNSPDPCGLVRLSQLWPAASHRHHKKYIRNNECKIKHNLTIFTFQTPHQKKFIACLGLDVYHGIIIHKRSYNCDSTYDALLWKEYNKNIWGRKAYCEWNTYLTHVQSKTLELSSWLFIGSGLFCIKYLLLLSLQRMLEDSVKVPTKNMPSRFIEGQSHHFGMPTGAKWVWPSMNCSATKFKNYLQHAPQVESNYWYCMQNNHRKIGD